MSVAFCGFTLTCTTLVEDLAAFARCTIGIEAETAVVHLVGAVHIGEPEYYDQLNDEFETYDVVLFEFIKLEDSLRNEKSDDPQD